MAQEWFIYQSKPTLFQEVEWGFVNDNFIYKLKDKSKDRLFITCKTRRGDIVKPEVVRWISNGEAGIEVVTQSDQYIYPELLVHGEEVHFWMIKEQQGGR